MQAKRVIVELNEKTRSHDIRVDYEDGNTGVTVKATAEWSSDKFMNGLREMFKAGNVEVITSITIGVNGITATFSRNE